MKKQIKIIILYIKYQLAKVVEYSESKQIYRKFVGGVWYYVVDVSTGDEYWTTICPPIEYALIVKQENWEVK